jgi:hypothetical protein
LPLTARRLRPWFWALLAALALDLSRAAFVEPHWDEDACLSIGWLLSRGWKLYRDAFSHHLPLDYLPSWLVAVLTGGSFSGARVFMLLVWIAFCALAYEAWTRRRGETLAPFFLALLSSQWLTYWYGEMMLVENYWAYAAALGLLLLEGRRPPGRRAAAALGACLGVLSCASLVCAAPLACFLIWLLADRGWRAQWRWAAAGAAAWLVPFWAWAALHADLSQLWAQAVRFNVEIYPRFFGYSSAVGGFWAAALASDARYFGSLIVVRSVEEYFEALLKLAVLIWCAAPAFQPGRRAQALWRAVFVLAVRARPERMRRAVPYHSAPYFVLATVAAAELLSAGWRRLSGKSRAARWGAAFAAAILLAPTLVATSQATLDLRRYAAPSAAAEAVSRALSACLPSGEKILVLPMAPRLYMDARREPAAPAVFYLPWQAAWPPQRDAHLAALRERKAGAVVLQADAGVWDWDWKDYAGDLQTLLDEGYAPVSRGAAGEDAPAFTVYARKGEEKAFVACAARYSTAPAGPDRPLPQLSPRFR